MKKIAHLIGIVAAAIMLGACVAGAGADGRLPGTKGLMTIEVLRRGAVADDYIRTARFIVFDNASVAPAVDVNTVMTLGQAEWDAERFGTLLKVSRNADKMLAVIVNEPAVLTARLERVVSPAELEEMVVGMADAFNANHTEPVAAGLPMMGVRTGIAVGEEHGSEGSAATVEVDIQRMVARVELWMKTAPQTSAEVTASTRVTLARSHDRGYLAGPGMTPGFGRIPTVGDPATTVTWAYTGSGAMQLDETERLVCAFYAPERTCSAAADADKLRLGIRNVATSTGPRSAETVLSQFTAANGSSQVITEVRRNNIYKIVLRVDAMQFEHVVMPWKDAGQGVVIDPQYYLRVNRDLLYLPDAGNEGSILAETDYDRDGDRGFPRGIRLGAVYYYDKDGDPVAAGGGSLYGWLAVSADGTDGDLVRRVRFSVVKSLGVGDGGCYAMAEVKAGNLNKLIRINR